MRREDFKNKKVTIFGLGVLGGGVGAARFFAKAGARVTVTDIKNQDQLKESIERLKGLKIRFVLGKHHKEDFINTNLVIKGPGVPNSSPYLEIVRKHHIPIDTDVGVFFELCKNPIIGITGSKGKSTTASMVYSVLKTKFKNTLLGGNIGISVLGLLPKIKKDSIIVLELSSWQIEGLLPHKKSPHIAAITNIFPEHLNRYKNFDEYTEAKKAIFKFQKKEDYLILNKALKNYSSSAKSQVIFSGGENREMVEIIGKIYKISSDKIKKAIDSYNPLSGRTEFVKEIRGVKFYNDTCATHPEATIYSIKRLKEKLKGADIILIAGGEDKSLDFASLNKLIEEEVKALILLPGTASDKIKSQVKTIGVNNMQEAVKEAKNISEEGDIILLSPASASFNLFKNEFDRGSKFKEEVEKLTS